MRQGPSLMRKSAIAENTNEKFGIGCLKNKTAFSSCFKNHGVMQQLLLLALPEIKLIRSINSAPQRR